MDPSMTSQQRILVVGKRNAGKCRELVELLAGLPVEVRSLSDFEGIGAHAETGTTFRENAAAKALAYARATGHWCVADDSGLEVPALGNEPGLYSSRWAGREGDDAANNRKLMERIAAVPRERRQARYVCVAVLASPEEVLLQACGTCEGVITDRPAGGGGFGYDPYFFVPELGKTMAELPPEAKHGLSHRGKALRSLVEQMRRMGGL